VFNDIYKQYLHDYSQRWHHNLLQRLLCEQGRIATPFFEVISGELEAVQPSTPLVTYRALDDKGFIETGLICPPDNLSAAGWPPTRQRYLFETSLQGVFADVRGGSDKRVASAAGEESIAISVHKALQE